jgi:hypothetical protein
MWGCLFGGDCTALEVPENVI